MRKHIILFIVFCLILACNLPKGDQANNADFLSTSVGLTLTAQEETITGQNTRTPGNGDNANEKTPVPEEYPLMTMTPTLSPSSYPTMTLSPTLTPTGGPAATLGDPDWKTSFDSGRSSFYDEDDENTTISAQNGALVLTSSLKNPGWHTWSMHYHKIKDFYLQADINIKSCSGIDEYGVVFRAPDYNHGYFFGLRCNGKYVLDYLADEFNYIPVIEWKDSDTIRSGSNQSNRLGVMASGNKITLFINDKKIDEVTDMNNKGEGMFGVYIAGYNTPGFTIELNDIAYWLIN